MEKRKVSVIVIDTTNGKYLDECINTILNQTYNNIEIVVVSKNNNNYLKSKSNKINVIFDDSDNLVHLKKLGLDASNGEYVMFMTSSDSLESVAIEVCIDKISNDDSDFVFFDWKTYDDKSNQYNYTSAESFFDKKYLSGKDIYKLLTIHSYDIMCKMFKRSFLINNIHFNDSTDVNETLFFIETVKTSSKVSLIHSPLYNIRKISTVDVNNFLNTYKVVIKKYGNDKEIMELFNSYMFYNFIRTYKTVSIKQRRHFRKEFYKIFKTMQPISIGSKRKIYKIAKKYKLFDNEFLFSIFMSIVLLSNAFGKPKTKKDLNTKIYNKYKNKPLKKQVLFIGFGWRYTGNNRYLFEEMIKNDNDFDIYYAVNSDLVPNKYRVKPMSKEFFEILYSSKVVIFESWIQESFKKRNDTVWIDLWHGTPLKKMFFDSEESEITANNLHHKINKYKTILKMDYLLTDNKNINKYFNTSFLYPNEKILAYGYPRVKYLVDNKDNEKLKNEIRKKLNVANDKKIVSYLPTWRDYNFKKKSYDFGYLLDKDKLQKLLGNGYVLLSKDHTYLSKSVDLTNTDIETQELLLVTDYLITDYSSVMFDSFAIDTPVCIYANDYEKYENSRGVYQDMWNDLSFCQVDTTEKLAKLIKNYKIDEKNDAIKEKYCYTNSGDKLMNFIKNILKD